MTTKMLSESHEWPRIRRLDNDFHQENHTRSPQTPNESQE